MTTRFEGVGGSAQLTPALGMLLVLLIYSLSPSPSLSLSLPPSLSLSLTLMHQERAGLMLALFVFCFSGVETLDRLYYTSHLHSNQLELPT